ncbi:hypothetical protein DQQ10_15365 [Pseudochryseolinea flava]|uniref:SHOCT domain-containing protein n=2 Tax=Pseudochryseolinea flava TaxID=2059302 RepID=A0A364Y1A1_9BACT|nr:hypothetical protein DQQ10_15365 [Pseudochryseolinea flava]
MTNELTGIVKTKRNELYFTSRKGYVGKISADAYALTDSSLPIQIRNAKGEQSLPGYNFVDAKEYETVHGNIARENDCPLIPRLALTPDEKYLVYTIYDSLFLVNTDNLKDVRRFGLSASPYNFFFTKELGDWVINLQALNNYKFPITKKYNIRKLLEADTRKHVKTVSLPSTTGTVTNKTTATPINQSNTTNANGSTLADEIRKLKALLDEGIITQEEFNLAKKKLLENPSAPPQSNSGERVNDYSDWLFIQSDKALQVRYSIEKAAGDVSYVRLQFRINFKADVFCSDATCRGYLLALGYEDPGSKKLMYKHYKFYNNYTEVYTMPDLVPVQMNFSNGRKRYLQSEGFFYNSPAVSSLAPDEVFYNCVDNILSNSAKSRCAGPGSWRDIYQEGEAVVLGGQGSNNMMEKNQVTPAEQPQAQPKKETKKSLLGM